MIRQAISCDMCGAEMQHTHRCFVAFDNGTELRLSGWSARRRTRNGALHLCGQKCLHQLVDQFMARRHAAASATEQAIAERTSSAERARRMDGSLTSLPTPFAAKAKAGGGWHFEAGESQARLAASPQPAKMPIEVMAERGSNATRAWKSPAWLREREREQREAADGRGAHRQSIA